MTENEITGDILDASIKLHRQFGAGLLESVYETLLEIELKKRGHKVERQKIVSFEYDSVSIENAFRLDMLVDDKVIVELKSTEKMSPVFAKQLKTYLAITKLQVGVVVNFGKATLKDGFLRFVNNYSEPDLCVSPLLRFADSLRLGDTRLCARVILLCRYHRGGCKESASRFASLSEHVVSARERELNAFEDERSFER